MAIKSLNQHIFRLAGGLVLLSSVVILLNVWFSTIDHAKDQLADSFQVAESVLKQILGSRDEQLYNSSYVLTADFAFKQAVATKDKATIDSVLFNHGNRIESDMMALIGLDGMVVSSTTTELVPDNAFPFPELVEKAKREGGASTILFIDGKLYQTMLLTVKAPRAIAITVLGFEIDTELLDLLKRISQLDISIEFIRDGDTQLSSSTLPSGMLKQALDHTDVDVNWMTVSLFGTTPYISKQFLFNQDNNAEIYFTLSEDVERLFGEFNQLQLKVTVIAILSIMLSLLLGAIVARKLSKPLRRLSDVAKTISKGEYQKDLEIDSNTKEIDELTDAFSSMQNNIQERQEEIAYQASHDLLTHLQNRYRISQILDQKFSEGKPFQVIGSNILGFRGVNDIFGYHNGDLCLQVIASRIKALGGQSARLNGGEFLWIPDEILPLEDISNMQKSIEQQVVIEDVSMKIRLAVGILNCPEDCENTESVHKRLNISLDEARATPDKIVFYEEAFEANYLRRLAIISELKKALISNQSELALFYQPKLHLNTGKIKTAEALIRWNSSVLGFVPPDEFIEIAEQAGLIGQVTDWVIGTAITGVHQMREKGLDINIAINLSAKDVLNKNLLPSVQKRLEKFSLPASCLSFEITESDLVSDPEEAVKELNKYREAGFSLAIDDFGTGYSSLSYLKSLPVSELKIDKSFVLKLDTQKSDQQIVQTIIQLAHIFGLGVIAEGVENATTLNMLNKWGCEWAQGYHICRPIPLQDLVEWHATHQQTDWLNQ